MARPPRPTQRRYHGRPLGNMQAAIRHLNSLLLLDGDYRGLPCAHYPQQLFVASDQESLLEALDVLLALRSKVGPIPNRPDCPVS